MTYLLDTCVISELVAKRPNPSVVTWIDTQLSTDLHLSVITIGEIAKGTSKLAPSRRKDSLTTWLNQTLPNRFGERILRIDTATMMLWGDMVGRLEKQGTPMPLLDSLIAAIAIQNSLRLVTRNTDDFAATGIVMLNPWLE
ncbi:MAG TPA: type II toxin-antitoxin system VapC family toxin [Nodosilinea sp.]|nr:type II toxin-antitoxin system VapC family toxin [Nodosilinea sp.]